jgi:hypothetical protein
MLKPLSIARIREIRQQQECGLFEARKRERGERVHSAIKYLENHCADDLTDANQTIVAILKEIAAEIFKI